MGQVHLKKTMKTWLDFVCLFYLMVTCTDAFTCEPHDDCIITGQMVADPDNCFNYFYCISKFITSAGPIKCPDNQYYDTTTGHCEYGKAVGQCSDNKCVTFESQGCVYSCEDNNFTYVSDPYDCSRYHACSPSNDENEVQQCQYPNLYFNGDVCVSDSSQCCNPCYPYCHFVRQLADPCDCHSFYLCLDVGPVDFSMKGTCADGTYFVEDLQACVDGNVCENACISTNCNY